MGKRAFLGGVAAIVSCTAFAGPTALNVMPTASVLGHREVYLSYWGSGTERRISKEIIDGGAIQFGFGDRIEFGVDSDFDGVDTYNIKAVLFEDEKGKWALSGGYMALRKNESQSYLVGRYGLNDKTNLHVGWPENGKSRWMAGIDHALSDEVTLMADTISGKDSYTYVGFNAAMGWMRGFDVTVSGGIPHERDNGYVWVVTIGYGLRL